MKVLPWCLLGGLALLVGTAPAGGAAGPGKPDAARTASDRYKDADALAARIDRHFQKVWAKDKVVPARLADDSEFVRRVYLDLAGRIPSVTEVRSFLDDKRSDKRMRLVEKLLAGPRYITHFVQVWRALLVPEANSNLQVRFQVPNFESWLRGQLTRDVTYDVMVRELLTAPVAPGGRPLAIRGIPGGEGSPLAFYVGKEFKPEELASATARVFLGVNVGCAQCHHHPFASWKKDQFWSFAAFFAGIQSRRQGDFVNPTSEVNDKRELTIPGTEKVVQARYLDGKTPKWKYKVSSRTTLAEWITQADNPYFARAAVNRMWAYFFGTGLIEPIDEMVGTENVASQPEVLTELAREFAAHKFDLKFLIRTITATRAYQLSSARSHPSQNDGRYFARQSLRGLSPEQLYDSVAQATGYREEGGNRNPFFFGGNSPRTEFLTRFSNSSDKPAEMQTSILQALTLMNGRLVASATSLESSETLAAICDAPFMKTKDRIETLYLATLSRKPKAKELARMVKFVEEGGAAEGKPASDEEKEKRYNQALADVFWALLNSGEFFLNH
jgi:hypothetical protein